MKRTNIYISGRTLEALKKLASKENLSISQIIRKAVGLFLREKKTKSAIYQKGNIFDRLPIVDSSVSPSNLSENHDKYLGEEYAKD